jgi:hypothetical protein
MPKQCRIVREVMLTLRRMDRQLWGARLWNSLGGADRGLKSPGARQSNGARKFGSVPGFNSASLIGSGRRKLCLGT